MQQEFTTHIKSKNGWFDIDLRELIKYRDLIFLFVKRNFAVTYKQSILGPLWLIIRPIATVAMYAFVFGNIANLSTDNIPQFGFYLAGNALWTYFAACLTETSNTFTANAAVFGKVYFPRLVAPISTVLTALLNLIIQVVMLLVMVAYYSFSGAEISVGFHILYAPVLVFQMALLGLGCGVIISSMTTKYRDMSFVLSFGVSLWMYISPVVYSISQMPESYLNLYLLNPIAPIMTLWRYAFFGIGSINMIYWGISWIVTFALLFLGVIMFSRVEKTFMDTI